MATYGYTRYSQSPMPGSPSDRFPNEAKRRGCVEVFYDEDTPSSAMPGPEFKRLIDRVQRGDKVLIPGYDRLTRDKDRMAFLLQSLEDLGVEVLTLADIES
ncbi:recombinase family protein [Amycolatopsis sp. NPDC059027]|uniref:recombinase family protein n=1 Tax=Amycolatopsis sp. NPDC059027 TaxID=3346709 RepID=UPI00366F6D4C